MLLSTPTLHFRLLVISFLFLSENFHPPAVRLFPLCCQFVALRAVCCNLLFPRKTNVVKTNRFMFSNQQSIIPLHETKFHQFFIAPSDKYYPSLLPSPIVAFRLKSNYLRSEINFLRSLLSLFSDQQRSNRDQPLPLLGTEGRLCVDRHPGNGRVRQTEAAERRLC